MALGQEGADGLADHRGAPQPAADDDLEARLAGRIAAHVQADVVDPHGRAVARRAGDRDLELARQERELGVQARPLADGLGVDARVLDLVGRGAGVVVGGHAAEAVAAGLDGVHLDLGQFGQDVGHVLQPEPVELDVLARGDVAVALVVAPRNPRQGAHLPGREGAVGNGDPQHVGVELQIEPVQQAQGAELVLREFAAQAPGDLAAELRNPLEDQRPVEFVVSVHGFNLSSRFVRRAPPACPDRGAPSAPGPGSPRGCLWGGARRSRRRRP